MALGAETLWLAPAAIVVAGLALAAGGLASLRGVDWASLVIASGNDTLRAGLLAASALLAATLVDSGRRRQPRPLRRVASILATESGRHRFFGGLIAILLMPALLGAFGTLKMLLPHYMPFRHDALFAALGRWPLYGNAPWEISHAVLASPWITVGLDRIYTLWMVLMPFALMAFAFLADGPTRARFFCTTILVWVVLGVFGAYLGSSAGPIFLHLLDHAEAPRFVGLLERLAHVESVTGVSLDCLRWRDVLWQAHVKQSYALGMGISAMPSLHVAVSVIYVLACFRLGRTVGRLALAFAILIWIGSIHLAWHYAIDGVVSAAVVMMIWVAVDRWLRASGYDRRTILTGRAAPAVAA